MPHPVQSLSHALAPLDDAALAARAASGDAAAFRLIMERNNARLYRVARGVLRNDAEAEDVRAGGLSPRFRQAEGFSRGSEPFHLADADCAERGAWPLAPAPSGNGAGRRRCAGGPCGAADPVPRLGGDVDPERAASRREIAGLLERAIDALPQPFRVVFVMRDVQEMTVEETAEALGIPAATVKTRLHRARRLLRQAVQAELGSVLTDAFPFAGRRCARTTATVLARLGLADPEAPEQALARLIPRTSCEGGRP